MGTGLLGFDAEGDTHINGGTITSGGAFVVGQNASASVTVQTTGTVAASVTDTYTSIGAGAATDPGQSTGQSVSTLDITGTGTTWKDAGGDATTPYSGAMVIGGGGAGVNALGTVSVSNGGNGQLTIDGGASVTEAGFALLGVTAGSSGQAIVQNGAHWTIGDGSMTLPGSIVVGSSTLFGTTPAVLSVGLIGQGGLNVSSNATVTVAAEGTLTGQFSVALGQGSSSINNTSVAGGNVTIDNALLDSHLGAIAIGNRGVGQMQVFNGGAVLAAAGGGVAFATVIGNNNYTLNGTTIASNGTLVVGNNAGISLFSASGDIVDGKNGIGSVTLNAGGSLASTGALWIGGYSGRGAATDSGSKFLLQGGTASVQNVTLYTGSTLDLEQGALALNFGAGPSNGNISVGALATISAVGNGGTVRAELIDNANAGAGTINNLGLIQAVSGILEVQASVNGTGTLLATSGGTMMLDRSVNVSSTVSLGGTISNGTLDLQAANSFNDTVSNFWGTASGAQNQIDVRNIGTLNQSLIWTQTSVSGGALQVIGNLGTVTLQIAGFHPRGFSIAGDGTNGAIVYARDFATTTC